MKWNYLLIFVILLFFLIAQTYASSNSQTHSLDTRGSDGRYFQFNNNCGLWFDADIIYFGDSNGLWSWMGTDGIKFYNLMIDSSEIAPDPWEIHISSNTNLTVGRLFKDGEVDLSIGVPEATNSSLRFYCGNRGAPHSVTGLDTWEFNSSSSYLNLTLTESRNVLISWRGPYYYWPQSNYPSIPILAQVEIPSAFHPSFYEYLTNKIVIGFTIRIVNEDTVDHTLGLAYRTLSENGDLVKAGDLLVTIGALSDFSFSHKVTVPFYKRDQPKEYTSTLNITRDGKLIIDPISHSFIVSHVPSLSLIYNLAFIGALTLLIGTGYMVSRRRE